MVVRSLNASEYVPTGDDSTDGSEAPAATLAKDYEQ